MRKRNLVYSGVVALICNHNITLAKYNIKKSITFIKKRKQKTFFISILLLIFKRSFMVITNFLSKEFLQQIETYF